MIPTCKLTLQQGTKIPNISAGAHADGMILNLYGFSKRRQYIPEGNRELPIPVGNYKNEGRKGKAKAIVAFGASTHVRRELSITHFAGKRPRT